MAGLAVLLREVRRAEDGSGSGVSLEACTSGNTSQRWCVAPGGLLGLRGGRSYSL
ncbi:hypothetical protein ABT095_13585 [Kitasatospora sp. NPDC002227]|uniref:hypothetical protein n=1 Tax=Kitasatospora sp. NPDC002227 TaxID=3154773 RepID=UPI0033265D48